MTPADRIAEATGALLLGIALGATARHWVHRLLAADRQVDLLVRDRIASPADRKEPRR